MNQALILKVRRFMAQHSRNQMMFFSNHEGRQDRSVHEEREGKG
jgi:hypothetical protein